MNPELSNQAHRTEAVNANMAAMNVDDEFAQMMSGMVDVNSGAANLEVAPADLPELTAENIDAEIDAMFGSVSEDDLAILGVAEQSLTARSLTGLASEREMAEAIAAEDRAIAAAHQVLGTAQAINTERSVSEAIANLFDTSEDDDRELATAGRR
ncbi:MAG TPA: hypothetical protein VF466_00445 [Candidatus Saccharimonadales bacterium]